MTDRRRLTAMRGMSLCCRVDVMRRKHQERARNGRCSERRPAGDKIRWLPFFLSRSSSFHHRHVTSSNLMPPLQVSA
ncbi:unnamed protein product [Victoria cruziana]